MKRVKREKKKGNNEKYKQYFFFEKCKMKRVKRERKSKMKRVIKERKRREKEEKKERKTNKLLLVRFLNSCLSARQTSNRNSVRRAAHIIQSDFIRKAD